jgi:hypothetical protein
MLVARGVPAVEVFAAVVQEVGSVLGADATLIARLDSDGAVTVVAGVGAHPDELAVGERPARRHPTATGRAQPHTAPGSVHRARGPARAQAQIGRVTDELTAAIEELRELARGIHPAILS